jgi:hypothetical protein
MNAPVRMNDDGPLMAGRRHFQSKCGQRYAKIIA